MRIVDLTSKEIIGVVKDLLKKGEFSKQPVTYELQKEALRRLVEAFESQNTVDTLMQKLDELDKYYTEKYSD